MKIKRILAGCMALAISLTAVGCSGGSGDESSSHVDKVAVDVSKAAETISDIPDGAQKELNWMSYYDINPTNDAEKTVDLTLFESKGGSIKFQRVPNSQKFDRLAAAVTSGKDVPDIFKYEWMAFPAQVVVGMYQPITDIVDFNDDMWKNVKSTADQFVLKDEYYVAPINFTVGTMMIYQKDVIENEGLDDPYELYQNGEWDWDAWHDIMSDYVAKNTGSEPRYGISGWFAPQVTQQTGKTMVTYKDGKFTSNLNDPDIERAENFLYDINKEGLYDGNWYNSAKDAFATGRILFYNMGTWAMTGTNITSGDYMVVPIPYDPKTEEKYMTADMLAYMWVKGSTAKEAVKCWLECSRLAQFDEGYQETAKEKFLADNPVWTEEMYDVFKEASSEEYTMVFDYGYGISSLMSDDDANADGNCVTRKLYEYVMKANEDGSENTWTSLKNQFSGTVDSELKAINDKIASFKS